MTTTTSIQTTLNHRARALTVAAAAHLRPRIERAADSAARAVVGAAAPAVADVVRAASPAAQTAARRLGETLHQARVEVDEAAPARRAQRQLGALHAAGEAARREVSEVLASLPLMDTTELTPDERDTLRMEVLVRTWSKVLLAQSALAAGKAEEAKELLDDVVEEFPAHPEFEAVEAVVVERLTQQLSGVQAAGSST